MTSFSRDPPTSAQVARLAGVSRTTVSFVLNDAQGHPIGEATRQRVLAAARELGYEPHAAARTLAGGLSGTVALVVPAVTHLHVDSFLAQLASSVNELCHDHGLKLLIESTDGAGREPGNFLKLVRGRRIDGLIVAHLRTSELAHVRRLSHSGVPLVVLGCDLPGAQGFQCLGDDTWRSAHMAVDHLLSMGHRQVAFVNYAHAEFHASAQRELGWRRALADRGIEADPAWAVHADITPESGYAATRELLARGVAFSALFAGNDTIAFGALRALHEAGLRVPQDVAVVGYDDIAMARFASPALTSVRSDPAGHGRKALHMLLAQMGRALPAAAPELAQPTLVVRESCGACLLNGGSALSGRPPEPGHAASDAPDRHRAADARTTKP